MKAASAAVAVLFVLAPPCICRADATFQGLGELAGGGYYSNAQAVSGDGSTVVGYSTSGSGTEAFYWRAGGPIQGLGDLSGGGFYSIAYGASYDGSVIVGRTATARGAEPFRWTAATGLESLGIYGGYVFADACSGDGSVIVGTGPGYAFRWTAASGAVDLGTFSSTYDTKAAFGVSADGSVVAGYGVNGQAKAFVWTPAGPTVRLPDLPGGSFQGYAKAVSADGLVVVGGSDRTSDSHREAFRWTSAGGIVPLGRLDDDTESDALGVSGDGGVIVGHGREGLGPGRAFIWDAQNGMRDLKTVLQDVHGLDLAGWTLRQANDISADGRVIVGYGVNPSGDTEAWVAVIPEPATLGLLAAGAAVAMVQAGRRRRRAGRTGL